MLNPEQKAELTKAVLSATGYRDCRYVDQDLKPVCVIGHLCYNRGVSGKDLDSISMFAAPFFTDSVRKRVKLEDFAGKKWNLIEDIQACWDIGPDARSMSETEARMAMLFLVEEAASK